MTRAGRIGPKVMKNNGKQLPQQILKNLNVVPVIVGDLNRPKNRHALLSTSTALCGQRRCVMHRNIQRGNTMMIASFPRSALNPNGKLNTRPGHSIDYVVSTRNGNVSERYHGGFRNGKFHGNGTYETKTFSYTGGFNSGFFNGRGVLVNKKQGVRINGNFLKTPPGNDIFGNSTTKSYIAQHVVKNNGSSHTDIVRGVKLGLPLALKGRRLWWGLGEKGHVLYPESSLRLQR